MSAEWIEHKGKKILYIRYGGLKTQQMMEVVTQATKMIVEAKSSDVLTLTDFRDAFASSEFMDHAKEQGKVSLPLTRKAAIVGVSGVKSILLRGINAFSPKPRVPFDTVDQAKDWLVE